MAEIKDGKFVRNETNERSMGGTERLTMELAERLDPKLLENVQIVSSRARELQEDKIRIFWAHDLPGDPESEFLKTPEGRDKFHQYVFVSNWQMQRYVERYGIPWSKCLVIRNAIEPFAKDLQKPDPKEQVRLIYHSTPHRGLNILAAVFDELCKKHDNIHLDVFSSFALYGWEKRDDQYKELFEALDKNPKITNHGTQPNSVIREHLEKSHIFAYPSIWAETSCLCLIEAMSAGNVCVHSNYAALYETAANWTQMYQMHEDMKQHAGILYAVLDNAITNVNQILPRMQSAKTYTDLFYGWPTITNEWNALLKNLNMTVKDTSIPKPTFSYSTTAA